MRTQTGAMLRWEAPPAETLREAFPGLKVFALCGVGGMGAVYRAEQARLGRTVAVKILPAAFAPDDEVKQRFEREARLLSTLNHPHVLAIHDFGSLADGTLYLVTEWAAGGDLAKLMDGKAHPPALVQAWVRQIAAALTAAHSRGIIHRDLKPANVLVLADGRLTLGDFGLAHAGAGDLTELTAQGALFGTFEYMAPEQMAPAGRVTPVTDIYSLGVITYQMLTGRVPRGAYTRPSRLVRVPTEVDSFLEAVLSTDPLLRPASASEFIRRFDHACGAPDRRQRRRLIGLGTVLIFATLAWARAEIIRAEREAMRVELRAAAVGEALAAARTNAAETNAAFAPLASPPAPVPEPAPARASGPLPVPTPPVAAPVVPSPSSSAGSATSPPRTTPPATHSPASPVVQPAATPWTWMLAGVNPGRQTLAGEWKLENGELMSGRGRCVFGLPAAPADDYDVALEFTRNQGKHSVAVFLPTLSGVGILEIDAWELGIAGLQLVDGSDMRRQGWYFPAKLKNGEVYRLLIEVRGHQVTADLGGESRMVWSLKDKRFSIPPVWQVRPQIGLAVGSWLSPTTFHRVAYRARSAETAK